MKVSGGSIDREMAAAEIENKRKLSYIKAWEYSEKTIAVNEAQKKIDAIIARESSKRAHLQAKLKQLEGKMDEKKGERATQIKNKIVAMQKKAYEERAMVEARRGEEILRAQETADKLRATGQSPKKNCFCL